MIHWKKYLQFLLVFTLLCSLLAIPASAVSQVRVTIDGQAVVFDGDYGQPFIDQAYRTQVPFRKTLETFGATVTWDQDTATAIAQKDGVEVRVPIGEPAVYVNGEAFPMDTAAIILEGRTYLPIRFVLEAFGATVTWNQDTACVVVTTGDPVLRVHFIDVGQGDAALIDYGETEVLIDGGDNKAGKPLVNYLSSYVDGKLDYVIATHPDMDHVGGLDDAILAFQVGEIIDSGYTSTSKTYQRYWAAVEQETDAILSYEEDRVIPLGPGVVLRVIELGDHWTTSNDSSTVCQLEAYGTKVLFTGDISQKAERDSLGLFEDIDILKVAHHGSASSTCAEFLDVTRPAFAVASYQVGNPYHHPTGKALQRLFDAGTTVYGTGKSGSVILTIQEDGFQFNTDLALTLEDAGA